MSNIQIILIANLFDKVRCLFGKHVYVKNTIEQSSEYCYGYQGCIFCGKFEPWGKGRFFKDNE